MSFYNFFISPVSFFLNMLVYSKIYDLLCWILLSFSTDVILNFVADNCNPFLVVMQ